MNIDYDLIYSMMLKKFYCILKDLVLNGVDVVRLNFSHGDFNDHKKTIKNIRRIRDELNVPVTILQDLQGPKIRIGELLQKNIKLVENYQFYITSKNVKGIIKKYLLIVM